MLHFMFMLLAILFRDNSIGQVAAHHVHFLPSEYFFCLRVPESNITFSVDANDGIHGRVHDPLPYVIALPDGYFGFLLFGDIVTINGKTGG